ncbi:MAG TPA: response regulator [Nocardioides sp.]|uniref:response regulator n=1 Tax=Nocardioides sp. TaxID=35761 RepID=UPI002BD9C6F8|nr:response regulator [Nocardioides sp.]HTW17005.1 response regulator [Nocardioides sp.]
MSTPVTDGEVGVPIRVLLVDDAVDVRRLVRTALRFRGGFEVSGEASTGAEAVDLVTALQPDIVVLDLGLPDLAGRDVLTRVREAAPGTKVVVFSGADPDDRSWFEEQAAGYVLKNEDLDYLVDLLVAVVRPARTMAVADLPQELGSVRQARSLVRRTLADWNLSHLEDEAILVVSELAANALNHAQSSYQVRVYHNPSTVRIEVHDGGAGTPEPQPTSATREGGRGLLLVSAMSASWGLEQTADGKVVWAELAHGLGTTA